MNAHLIRCKWPRRRLWRATHTTAAHATRYGLSNAAATGRRAGGGRRIADWWHRSWSSTDGASSSAHRLHRRAGRSSYPVPLRYAIAETVKGFGFPGAGTNLAHNLPLGANPHYDAAERQRFNTGAYQTHGEIWTLVVPKRSVIERFSPAQANALLFQGVARVRGTGEESVVLCAIGAYQLAEAVRAHQRLREHGIGSSVVYLIEPARLRAPRDSLEEAYVLPEHAVERWFPSTAPVARRTDAHASRADCGILIPINRILTQAISVTGNPAAQMAAQRISN